MKKTTQNIQRTIVAMALMALVGLSGCGPNATTGGNTTSNSTGVTEAGKVVGCLDYDAINQLPEFKKAAEDIEKNIKAKREALEKEFKGVKQPTPEQQRKLQDAQLDLQKEAGKILNPLKLRAEAATAMVAHDKKILVVLDKRIVVHGVPDITEDVKKLFQGSGEVKMPEGVDSSKAPIGYFDNEVVQSLKVFQEAQLAIFKKRQELLKMFEEKVKNMQPAERELLERELRLKLETYKETVMQPLVQEVNDSVKEVAQAQGLSLVLDKQHVMQGGRNMTNEVVESFLKKVGTKGSAKPAASATPAGSPTPGGH